MKKTNKKQAMKMKERKKMSTFSLLRCLIKKKRQKQKGNFSTIAVKTRAVGWNAVTVERKRWSHDDHRQYEGIPGGC